MTHTLRHFVSLLLLVLVIPAANAEQLTPQQSLQRMRQTASQRGMRRIANATDLTLAYTSASAQGNLYYVFNHSQKQGFVITGADDLAPAVLASVPAGQFEQAEMPPAMLAWLSEYDRQIEYAISTGTPLYASSLQAPREKVNTLLSTTWGQGDSQMAAQHYNTFCPKIDGVPCPTGCVATAMAQVMNYHMWPTTGKGSKSYTTRTMKFPLSVNFGSTTYEWSAMQDHYGYTYLPNGGFRVEEFTQSANNAVSRLMYHCGVSIEMDYMKEASGASELFVPGALIENFGYDLGAHVCERIFFTDAAWEDLVYAELAAQRPVIYCGATLRQEGHCFVCDGYENGLYHINWGWNGLSDGFYAITGTGALHPQSQGTGGSAVSDPFSEGQKAIVGVQRPQAGSKPFYSMNLLGSYTISDYTSKQQNTLNEGSYGEVACSSGIFNMSALSMKANFGLKLVASSGETYILEGVSNGAIDVQPLYGINSYYVSCSDVPAGTYKAYPVFRVQGESEWTEMPMPTNVTAPTITYTRAAVMKSNASLFCNKIVSTDNGNNLRQVNAELQCIGNNSTQDFSGTFTLGLCNPSTGRTLYMLDASGTTYNIKAQTVDAKNTATISLTLPADIPDGHYMVKPFAFQYNSTSWTPFYYYNINTQKVYTSQNVSYDIWVAGSTISTTELSGIHSPVMDKPATDIMQYDLQGRPCKSHTISSPTLRLQKGRKIIR